METRKVQKVGGGTYTVSVPVQWANEYGIEAGETVYLFTHLDGSLVIRRNEREESDLASVDIEIDNSDPSTAERLLCAGYTAGFKRITLRSSDQLTQAQRRAINSTTRSLTGVEIAEETEAQITVQGLLDATDVSIRQSVLQLRFTTLSMHEAAMAAFAGDTTELEYISQQDDEADRVYQLITRHFNRSLIELDEIDQLGVTRPKLFEYYLTARQLERIADHAVKIARVVDRIDSKEPHDLRTEVSSIGADSRQIVEDASDAVVNGSSIQKAHTALNHRTQVVQECTTIDQDLVEQVPEEAYLITRVLDSLVRTARYGGNVAELAIQSSLRS